MPESQLELFCTATVYARSASGENRSCANLATKGQFCYSHDPENSRRREKRVEEAAKDRIRVKELRRRKLLLIPVLDKAQAARIRINREDGAQRFGALIIINILRDAIREEK